MDLQPDTVTESVPEILGIAGVGDHGARGRVDLAAHLAGGECLPAGALRGGHQLIDVVLPLRGLAQHERPGHVGVVAGDQRAEVDLHEVARRQFGVGGPVMRDRGVRSRRDDRLERHPVGAVVKHQRLEVARHLPFGASRAQPAPLDQVGQRRVGGLAREPQQRLLPVVLDLPQRLDRAGGPHQLHVAGGSRQHVVLVDRDDVAFEAQPRRPAVSGQPGEVRPARPLDLEPDLRRLPCSLGAVAAVGGQRGRRIGVGNDQQRCVGTGEPRQITDVDQV